MKWFYNLRISTRIVAGFIMVALVSGFVGYNGITNAKIIAYNGTVLYENMTVPLVYSGEISAAIQEIQVHLGELLLYNNPQMMDKNAEYISEHLAELQNYVDLFRGVDVTPEVKLAFEKYDAARIVSMPLIERIVELGKAGRYQEALLLLQNEMANATEMEQNAINSLSGILVREADAKAAHNEAMADTAMKTMLLMIALGMVIAIVSGWYISRSICSPVARLTEVAKKLAVGDVSVKVEKDTRDEVGILMGAFAEMVRNIQEQVAAAERIASGDLSVAITAKSEGDVLSKSIQLVVDTLRSLAVEVGILTKAAVEGRLEIRGDADKFKGGYRKIVEGINRTQDAVVDKVYWYEALLDAVPIPVSATDLNLNWTFINKALEGLLGIKRQEVSGKQCSSWHATICGTENCSIARLRNNQPQTVYEQAGRYFEADASYITNVQGEKIGHIEVVRETTQLVTRADYQALELDRVMANLQRLAEGNLDLDLTVGEGNQYTTRGKGIYQSLNRQLAKVKESIEELSVDATWLAAAAVEGKLANRADATKHAGDFKKVIEGFNRTLDAVIQPVQEASAVLQEMARGNLRVNMQGNYQGDHAAIKNVLNDTINTIFGYVNEITQVLTEFANGNLDIGITDDYRGDFVEIKNSINLIISSMNEVLGEINNAAEQVAAGSRDLSNSSQALSQGSAEQASSVEEITASMTEIGAQTRQNAVNANQANELAQAAKDNAIQGNAQMKEMLRAMEEINESSANISKIIKVIDEIAFQTNILALNAAVEAARAGQHGKGFAVVAEEVRNLAARSANAAKETTGLIEGSIKKVEAGTRIANATAGALVKIVDGVSKATDLVGEIAIASSEQATGIAQVNQGINQVAQVTQTNTATAEQSAAASEELSSQAEVLKTMVGKFKLKKAAGLNPVGKTVSAEVLRMVEEIMARKNQATSEVNKGRTEAAFAGPQPRISLDDKNFGKY